MANLTQAQVIADAEKAGWPASQIPTLLGIIGAEDGSLDPNVVAWGSGPTVLADSEGWPPPVTGYDEAAVGLTQELISPAAAVNPTAIAQLQDPVNNLETALGKYEASGWQPWQGDAYVNAHPSILQEKPVPATPGKPTSGAVPAGSSAVTTSFPGGSLDPLNWPGEIVGSAASSIAGSIGIYILKGVLSLGAGALFVFGVTLLTGRGSKASSPAAPAAVEEPAAALEPFAAAA